jgi:hypothetical protein
MGYFSMEPGVAKCDFSMISNLVMVQNVRQ